MAYLTLVVFLLAVAALWAAVLVVLMARQLLAPRRMTDERAFVRLNRTTPADMGLTFTPMGFTVNDARRRAPLRIAGWWIPAAGTSGRTVVIVHGYGDAKVGGIAWAPAWHELGWNVLAVDLRAHGESEGTHSTGGYFEREDLDQVLNAIRAEKPAATQTLALFGVSLGAACVAATAARRSDIDAVVLESPFVTYPTAVRTHVRRSGFPLVGCSGLICRLAELMSGSDFRIVAPAVTVPTISAPVLIFVGTADPLTSVAGLQQALAQRPAGAVSQCVVFNDVPHIMGLAKDPDGYRAALATFLDATVNRHHVGARHASPAIAD